ncbi:hypothetical protein PMAYCL1PPCAC_06870, partial [Pristionchus mayeri]
MSHERRLIYEQLRKRMAEQYSESTQRVTTASVSSDETKALWYLYLIPYTVVDLLSTTILIFTGEVIDRYSYMSLGQSILGSAAMGNMVSNVVNIFLSKYTEPLIGFFGIKRPLLSIDQWNCRTAVVCVNVAKVAGIVGGSIIGMCFLLLIDSPHRSDVDHDDEKAEHEENELE